MYFVVASLQYASLLTELVPHGEVLYALQVLVMGVSFAAIPLIAGLSLAESVLPSRPGRLLYRLVLLITVPATCYRVALTDPNLRGPGFWASAGVVLFAALVEVLLVVLHVFKEHGRRKMLVNQGR